ncbi:MAG: hypothetical protein IJY52_08385 [Anaerotignum sp.]|nr:hypothetical protein [Anaerotignum sp.]
MKKTKLNCGHAAYEVSRVEVMRLGGFGICDNCNTTAETGYLVPVLNRWLCPKCYEEFNKSANFYQEDMWVEEKNCRYYESMIPMEVSADGRFQLSGHSKW